MRNTIFKTVFFLLSFSLFFSCNDDDIQVEYLALTDISLKQTVNGNEKDYLLTSPTDAVRYSTELTFADKTFGWNLPTFVQKIDTLLVTDKDKVVVKDTEGVNVESVEVLVTKGEVKVSFQKVGIDYSYIPGNTYTIDVEASLKDKVSKEDLTRFIENGVSSECQFYPTIPAQNVKSNQVMAYLEKQPYSVKGDPRNNEYKNKLNVVYFIPSDIVANEDYQERISTILLKHQLFICKWMKHWGYEEKSFGLPLAENGMVDIVTVQGNLKKADYPYSGGNGKMKKEIDAYYSENGLKFLSDHTLVITATNGNIDDTPFYGFGKWCYALDFPEMSYDLYNIDPLTNEAMNPDPLTTSLIGGLLHELGHGLNEPHVGATYSQNNDPQFGTPLMGSGNQTYGKKPTFLHPSSAAIMNNCQISTFVDKTFYGNTTSSIILEDPIIDGSKCTIKGSFTASDKVTEVVVRFFNSTEAFQGGASGYTSVAFVVKPSGNNFEITIPIEELRIRSFKYKVGVMLLMENGTSSKKALPNIYRLEQSGSDYTLVREDISNDGNWEVTVSHNLPKDDAIKNAPGSLVDGDLLTSLSMVKPGKSYAGIAVPATDVVYAVVNFNKQIEFNTISLTNRNLQNYLNPKGVSFYGSNDGMDFTEIKTGVELPENVLNTISLGKNVKYQYLKMTYDSWDKDSGSTMQFAELTLGYVK